jgi:hypothetical protein
MQTTQSDVQPGAIVVDRVRGGTATVIQATGPQVVAVVYDLTGEFLDGQAWSRFEVITPAPKRCSTIGCYNLPTTLIAYNYRRDPDTETGLVCGSCADGYGRRVVLASFRRYELTPAPGT